MKESDKSGGKRVGEAKHGAADKRRGLNYRDEEIARYAAIGTAPLSDPNKAVSWVARIALQAVEDAATDPGLLPEARREQLVRLIPQAVKALDPARLAVRIDALEEALDELNHAGDKQRPATRETRGAATQ